MGCVMMGAGSQQPAAMARLGDVAWEREASRVGDSG
jgi:hypothetical protein